MADITRYVIVNAQGSEENYEYERYDDAQAAVVPRVDRGEQLCIIERTYTFADSELVWTSTGDNTWPPPPTMRYESVGVIRDGKTVWSETRKGNS